MNKTSDYTLKGFDVTAQEWETAHAILDSMPNGSKLCYSAVRMTRMDLPRPAKGAFFEYLDANQMHQTFHSFLKENNTIVALAQGKTEKAIIGEGGYAIVKVTQDEEGNLALEKINKKKCLSSHRFLVEMMVSKREGQSNGGGKITLLHSNDNSYLNKQEKMGMNMVYLGPNLKTIIHEMSLDNVAERFDLAIESGLALLKYNQNYFHNDIKPANMTYHQNIVHIIDHAFAVLNIRLNEVGFQYNCTKAYSCYPSLRVNISYKEKECFAFKRLIYMPEFIQYDNGSHRVDIKSILTVAILKEYNLLKYFDTSDSIDQRLIMKNSSILGLTALLICAKLQLNLGQNDLEKDAKIACVIVELYKNRKSDPNIKQIIESALKDVPNSLQLIKSDKELFLMDHFNKQFEINNNIFIEFNLSSLAIDNYYTLIKEYPDKITRSNVIYLPMLTALAIEPKYQIMLLVEKALCIFIKNHINKFALTKEYEITPGFLERFSEDAKFKKQVLDLARNNQLLEKWNSLLKKCADKKNPHANNFFAQSSEEVFNQTNDFKM